MGQLDFDLPKTLRRSVSVLVFGCIFSLGISFVCGYRMTNLTVCPGDLEGSSHAPSPCVLSLGLGDEVVTFPGPQVQTDVALYLDPAHPSLGKEAKERFVLQLRKNGLTKKVSLPERVDLVYDYGLRFATNEGLFWIELSKGPTDLVLVHVYIVGAEGDPKEVGSFLVKPETRPLRSCLDFPLTSPLRSLSEARFIGKDAFLAKYGEPKEEKWRFEIGQTGLGTILSLRRSDFLVWQEGRWQVKNALQETESPALQLVLADEKMAVFQGWEGDEYLRFGISFVTPSPLKIKAEELFSAVRIRSKKQISCMLDKQCFVLRVGDWILKQDNRWKVLRKKEEKDAYIHAKIGGELFVLDRIDSKDKHKAICGAFFTPERSHCFPVEVTLSSQDRVSSEKRKLR
jgi:hypothetical protein